MLSALTKSNLGLLGIGENELAMLNDVSAAAVQSFGYYSSVQPYFTYDPEEYRMFMSIRLPVAIETALEIEEKFYELAEQREGFPIDKIMFTVRSCETINAV